MKRQRAHTEPSENYGYGYSSYGDASQAAVPGAPEYALNPSGVNTQARPVRPPEASLSHGMQPNLQPNMQPGVAGTQHPSTMYSGVPMNMNGANMGNQYGMAGLSTAGQYGQGMGTTLSMSQNMGNIAGPPQLGHPGMSDVGTNMVHSLGQGMGQNMMQSMAPNNMSMGAPDMGGAQLEAQAGLAPALGQGMGISEGFPCVKLRGLPFDANEQDIAVWLVCLGPLWWPHFPLCRDYGDSMVGTSSGLVMGQDMLACIDAAVWDSTCVAAYFGVDSLNTVVTSIITVLFRS